MEHRVAQTAQAVGGQAVLKEDHVSRPGVPPGQGGKSGLLQGEQTGFEGLVLRQEPRRRRPRLKDLGGQQMGDLGVLLQDPAEIAEGPAAAHQLDAHPLPELLHGQQLHQPHLSGRAHMGAAAGAAVRPGEGDDAHLSGELLLAPVGDVFQLFP